jgi:DNA-binding transcriptional LysR family regulator
MAGESWILTPPDSLTYQVVVDAFRARDIDPPKARLMTYSVHLRTTLAASGDFVTVLPGSVLRFNASQFGLKALPIALPVTPWPVAVVTLKNRTLNPVAQRFVEHDEHAVAFVGEEVGLSRPHPAPAYFSCTPAILTASAHSAMSAAI